MSGFEEFRGSRGEGTADPTNKTRNIMVIIAIAIISIVYDDCCYYYYYCYYITTITFAMTIAIDDRSVG